jgi:poly(3-hydroxybutyrate) depolymerase
MSRIFAVGMSYGGLMSDTLGCQAPDIFRALGVIAGALYTFGQNSCMNLPIAAWMTHGTADATVPISGGQAARDRFLTTNGCSTAAADTQTVVMDANTTCTIYNQCTAGNYPIVWCPVNNGGHTIPSWSGAEIAKFFLQF